MSSLSESEAFLLIGIGEGEVGAQAEDSLLHRHLQDQVHVMRHSHELGEC
jgi:hypothetical protein